MFVTKDLFRKTISLARALICGEHVNEERVKKRIEICSTCQHVEEVDNLMRCGICGCRVRGDRSLINLALYEETGEYGCKHPAGSRWKAEGV